MPSAPAPARSAPLRQSGSRTAPSHTSPQAGPTHTSSASSAPPPGSAPTVSRKLRDLSLERKVASMKETAHQIMESGTPPPPDDHSYWGESQYTWNSDQYTPSERDLMWYEPHKGKHLKDVFGPRSSSYDLLIEFFRQDALRVDILLHQRHGVTLEELSAVICKWLFDHTCPTRRGRTVVALQLGTIIDKYKEAQAVCDAVDKRSVTTVRLMKNGVTHSRRIQTYPDLTDVVEELCPRFSEWKEIFGDEKSAKRKREQSDVGDGRGLGKDVDAGKGGDVGDGEDAGNSRDAFDREMLAHTRAVHEAEKKRWAEQDKREIKRDQDTAKYRREKLRLQGEQNELLEATMEVKKAGIVVQATRF
ncbi:hypothetical protein IAT38_006326 [Cryptococcus sp. DSM 104549]